MLHTRSWKRLGSADVVAREPAPPPRAAGRAAHAFTPAEQAAVDGFSRGHVIGDPDTVRAGLHALVERTGADELMLTTMAHGPDHRLRSLRLVAEVMELAPVAA
ncbi:MAG: hypothetical protein ACR2JF_17665 [Iamia sp.]